MIRSFNIDFDCFDWCGHWEDYVIDDWMLTDEQMFEDVRGVLEELGGGHADIWETDDNGNETLYLEIEV